MLDKINIVGCSGSGKTTFGVELGKKIDLDPIEIDQLFWKPNWTETPMEELAEIVTDKISTDRWLLVGNYNRLTELKWKDVDTVIWIDTSYVVTIWQVFWRAMQRSWDKTEIWPGSGCRESFYKAFCTKGSIILWALKMHSGYKRRYEREMKEEKYKHIKFIRLKNRKEMEQYLSKI